MISIAPLEHELIERQKNNWTIALATDRGGKEVDEDVVAEEDLPGSLKIAIVADGMGGHDHARLAAEITTSGIISALRESLEIEAQQSHLEELLLLAFASAHREILRSAHGGGATVDAVLLTPEQAILAHIGDTRSYSFNPLGGKLDQLTHDDIPTPSELVEKLGIPLSLANTFGNIVNKNLGHFNVPYSIPTIIHYPLPATSHVLLCSDGLYKTLTHEQIRETISRGQNPQHVVDELITRAQQAGAKDNISAILISNPNNLAWKK